MGTVSISHAQEFVWSKILQDIRKAYPSVTQISVDSLAHWMEADNNAIPVLLDVREQEEFDISHLDGAIRISPEGDDFSALDDLPRDTPIVAYCSVGYRSSAVAEKLESAGFTNVSNLEGSIFTWANNGYPVYRENESVQDVHPYNRVWGQLLNASLRRFR